MFEIDLGKEIGLILYRIGGGSEKSFPIHPSGRGIVPRSNIIVSVPYTLLEDPKLDEFVAHHIGVGGQSLTHTLYRVLYHTLPILLVQVYHLIV